MGIHWPWGKMKTIRCPDGKSREVYRDLDHACPLFIPGWKADVSADLQGVGELTAEAKAMFQTQIQGLLFALTEQNQSLMISFRTVYLAYSANPCANDDFFQRQIESLLEEQRGNSALKLKIAALLQLASTSPTDMAQITTIFGEIAATAGGNAVATAASLEIADSRLLAQQALQEE